MTVTKYYCDRCKKEIGLPTSFECTTIQIESLKNQVVKKREMPGRPDVSYSYVEEKYLFDTENLTICLCEKCSIHFKKIYDVFMNKS